MDIARARGRLCGGELGERMHYEEEREASEGALVGEEGGHAPRALASRWLPEEESRWAKKTLQPIGGRVELPQVW